MLRTTSSGILLLALAACGPAVAADESIDEPQCDPWGDTCEVTLLPSWGARSVLNLEVAEVTLEPTDEPAEALDDGYIRASIGRYLVLQSELDEPRICLLPETFASLDEVPLDAGPCDCRALTGCWSSVAYFGLLGQGSAELAGAGIFLRTDKGDLYRGRVLEAGSGLEQGTLKIEYEGVM